MKFTEEYVKVFGLWLGSKLKSHKNASIDELFKEFNDKYPPSNQRDHDIAFIKKVITTHGTVSCYELEAEASPCINSIGNTLLLVEGYLEEGVDTGTYVGGREEGLGYASYEELSDDVLSEIAEIMVGYEADCEKTAKRSAD